MRIPFAFFTDNKQHIIALVGGGGKTTLMYALAQAYAAQGKRVIAMTSTHILVPERLELWVQTGEELECLWSKGSYAVLGQLEEKTGKLIAPQKELYTYAEEQAEIIICEADGAKHKPLKVPRQYEPVISEECDIVIGVVGLEALGKSWGETCFGFQEAQGHLDVEAEDLITAHQLAELLLAEWGTKKLVGKRDFYLVLNKMDLLVDKGLAEQLQERLVQKGLPLDHIWLRGLA